MISMKSLIKIECEKKIPIGIQAQLTLASARSCVPMLTTVHPIAFAELRPSVWFSFLSHGFRTFFVLIARSSIVPGTATFISLLHSATKKNK